MLMLLKFSESEIWQWESFCPRCQWL